MATSSVVTATYKTITAILEANGISWWDIITRHYGAEAYEKEKLHQKVKVLDDQLFHFTDGNSSRVRMATDEDFKALAGTGE